MKKILFIISIILLGCSNNASPTSFNEQDEAARQLAYSYFRDHFVSEADSLGGNILGFKKLDATLYQVDAVMFRENDALRETYELQIDDEILGMEMIGQEILQFEPAVMVESVSSDSGRYEAVVSKNLIPVNFYTTDEVEIPGFLGRYDLSLIEGEKSDLVDYSFDPFSTNQPFEIKQFSNGETYLEYFEHDLGRLFNMYDIEQRSLTNVEMAGIHQEGFWYEGRYIVCTTGGEFKPVIAAFTPPNWGMEDQDFLYPPYLNEEDDIWGAISTVSPSRGLDCRLDGNKLIYNEGEIEL